MPHSIMSKGSYGGKLRKMAKMKKAMSYKSKTGKHGQSTGMGDNYGKGMKGDSVSYTKNSKKMKSY